MDRLSDNVRASGFTDTIDTSTPLSTPMNMYLCVVALGIEVLRIVDVPVPVILPQDQCKLKHETGDEVSRNNSASSRKKTRRNVDVPDDIFCTRSRRDE